MYIPTSNAKITNISQTRIWIRIRKDPRAGFGSGSKMTLQVGSGSRSGSKINSFGSATLVMSKHSILEKKTEPEFCVQE